MILMHVEKHCSSPLNYLGSIIESDARPTGVKLKRIVKLLTVIKEIPISYKIRIAGLIKGCTSGSKKYSHGPDKI